MTPSAHPNTTREHLLYRLAEAAELEHDLMCTYLYAAFSLKRPDAPDFSQREAAAVGRFRQVIHEVAREEMAHLAAVWNITSALGGPPRVGRGNFPLDPGSVPADVVVKLAPFGAAALQHFVHLERPADSGEPDGRGFEGIPRFERSRRTIRLVPMPVDYETIGQFYACLERDLVGFAERVGEARAFAGDPALQLTQADTGLVGLEPVRCLKSATWAMQVIVEQGEGAPRHAEGSHFARFAGLRDELARLTAENPSFSPAFPAAVNPVLRPPPRAAGRVWLEDELAAATVDLANSSYMLMLRLLSHAYILPRPSEEKSLALELSRGLMHAVSLLGERSAMLPAGPSVPGCNAGMSFTVLRDTAALPPGPSARAFFVERFDELARAASDLDAGESELVPRARRLLDELAARAGRAFGVIAPRPPPSNPPVPVAEPPLVRGEGAATPGAPKAVQEVDEIEGKHLNVLYDGKKCIHARFCVTWAPRVFLANVEGRWIRPDQMDAEAVAEIAHVCPSGAIRYRRKDGRPDESAPPVNLLALREGGPYALRAELVLAGSPAGFRATLCRCGASKRKPYCDGSHRTIAFAATGEPPSGVTEALEARDGPLEVEPQTDGPLDVRGSLEIVSGTGRVVARMTRTRLCRCGGSANKPFCDGTHARIGFRT